MLLVEFFNADFIHLSMSPGAGWTVAESRAENVCWETWMGNSARWPPGSVLL